MGVTPKCFTFEFENHFSLQPVCRFISPHQLILFPVFLIDWPQVVFPKRNEQERCWKILSLGPAKSQVREFHCGLLEMTVTMTYVFLSFVQSVLLLQILFFPLCSARPASNVRTRNFYSYENCAATAVHSKYS